MPESGASGSVGAPLEESGALPGNGAPYGLPPFIPFRPRAGYAPRQRGYRLLRLIPVRSRPRSQASNAKLSASPSST